MYDYIDEPLIVLKEDVVSKAPKAEKSSERDDSRLSQSSELTNDSKEKSND